MPLLSTIREFLIRTIAENLPEISKCQKLLIPIISIIKAYVFFHDVPEVIGALRWYLKRF